MKSPLEGKSRLVAALLTLLTVALPLLAGCKKDAIAPAPIAVEQVPATLQQTFQQAPPEIRQSAAEVVTALKNSDDSKALLELNTLMSKPELTPAQRQAAASSMLGVHARLRAAADKGDKLAEEALEHYRATK